MIVIKVKGRKNVREGSGSVIRIGASGFERNIDGSATLFGKDPGYSAIYVLFLDGSVALTPRSWMGKIYHSLQIRLGGLVVPVL
jgi:hypothetical protein